MVVPVRTADQRREASVRAIAARQRRAEVSGALKAGEIDLVGLFELAEHEAAVAGMRVSAVLESLPRMGPRRSAAAMQQLRISSSRRLRGLGSIQRGALLALRPGAPETAD